MFGSVHSCRFELQLLRICRSDRSKYDRSCGSVGAIVQNVTTFAEICTGGKIRMFSFEDYLVFLQMFCIYSSVPGQMTSRAIFCYTWIETCWTIRGQYIWFFLKCHLKNPQERPLLYMYVIISPLRKLDTKMFAVSQFMEFTKHISNMLNKLQGHISSGM